MPDLIPDLLFALPFLGTEVGMLAFVKKVKRRKWLIFGIMLTIAFIGFAIFRNNYLDIFNQYVWLFYFGMIACPIIALAGYLKDKR